MRKLNAISLIWTALDEEVVMTTGRLSLEDVRNKMLNFYNSKPVILDDEGIRDHVETTMIHRYRASNELLDSAQDAIRKASSAAKSDSDRKELDLAIGKIDEAVNMVLLGAMGFNKSPDRSLPRPIRSSDIT